MASWHWRPGLLWKVFVSRSISYLCRSLLFSLLSFRNPARKKTKNESKETVQIFSINFLRWLKVDLRFGIWGIMAPRQATSRRLPSSIIWEYAAIAGLRGGRCGKGAKRLFRNDFRFSVFLLLFFFCLVFDCWCCRCCCYVCVRELAAVGLVCLSASSWPFAQKHHRALSCDIIGFLSNKRAVQIIWRAFLLISNERATERFYAFVLGKTKCQKKLTTAVVARQCACEPSWKIKSFKIKCTRLARWANGISLIRVWERKRKRTAAEVNETARKKELIRKCFAMQT